MQTDPRLSGYLSRALSHEMAAVQQYLLQAKLVGMWGMATQSAKFRTDVSEELTHAERLMERMLILGIPCMPRNCRLPVRVEPWKKCCILIARWKSKRFVCMKKPRCIAVDARTVKRRR